MRKLLLFLLSLFICLSTTTINADSLLDPYYFGYAYTIRNVFEKNTNESYYYRTKVDYEKFCAIFDVSLINKRDSLYGTFYKYLEETDITNDFSYRTKKEMNNLMPYLLQGTNVAIFFDLSYRRLVIIDEWSEGYTNFSKTNSFMYPTANHIWYIDVNYATKILIEENQIETIFPNSYKLIALIVDNNLIYCYPKENLRSGMAGFVSVKNGSFNFDTRKYNCDDGYTSYISNDGLSSSGCKINTYTINYYVDDTLKQTDAKEHGAKYTINYTPVNKQDMDFKYWVDEDNNIYYNNDIYTLNKSIKLYAHYEKNNYNVNYYVDDVLINSYNYKTNNNALIKNNTITKDYYIFDYWYDSNNNKYYPNEIYTLKKDLNLYAHYYYNGIFVNYYDDDELLKQELYNKNDMVTILGPLKDKPNYIFKGYKDINNNIYLENETYIFNEDINLYGYYELEYYTIKIPKKVDIKNNNTSFNIIVEGTKQVNITVSNSFEIKEFNGKESVIGTAYIENNIVYISHPKLSSGYWMATLNINVSSK